MPAVFRTCEKNSDKVYGDCKSSLPSSPLSQVLSVPNESEEFPMSLDGEIGMKVGVFSPQEYFLFDKLNDAAQTFSTLITTSLATGYAATVG